MKKTTVISFCILLVFIGLLIGFSLGSSSLWENHFSHWSIPPAIAFLITLLIGLVLKDDLFELDSLVAVNLRTLRLKVEIKKHLIGALLIICFVAVILELVQFALSQGKVNFLDPMIIIGGSVVGIIVHVIGSKLLMKRVEFELERWEDNVL